MTENIPTSSLYGFQLFIKGSEMNKKDSAVDVRQPDLFKGDKPYDGGGYDARMGTTEPAWNCYECSNKKKYCGGHFGTIKLNYPMKNTMFLREIVRWLKIVCFNPNCGKLILKPDSVQNLKGLKALTEYAKLSRSANKILECVHCHTKHPFILKDKDDDLKLYMSIPTQETKFKLEDLENSRIPLHNHTIKEIFSRVSMDTLLTLGFKSTSHPSNFIIDYLAVPPNTIRPDIRKIGGGRSNNNDTTTLLQYIIRTNNSLNVDPNNINDSASKDISLMNLYINEMIKGSSETTNKRKIKTHSKKPLLSLAKRYKGGKHGRIRWNLLGRRVNDMMRSVITCNIYLRADEIGIPINLARTIPVPEQVRHYNIDRLTQYFNNRTDRYPGCHKLWKKSLNNEIDLNNTFKTQYQLEEGDILYRDLIDGDVINFNRAPSLLPSSITALKVKILNNRGYTLQINVTQCALFNADFDGDAMSTQHPSETAYEIEKLCGTNNSFISFGTGGPMIGQAQDSIIGSHQLTLHDVKIDSFHHKALFSQVKNPPRITASSNEIVSGRSVISSILRYRNWNIDINTTPNFYNSSYEGLIKYNPEDIQTNIKSGNVISGVIDKASAGEKTSGSIFHKIYNKYGPKAAITASYDLQQVALNFVKSRGFTTSVEDIIVPTSTKNKIYEEERGLIKTSLEITKELNEGKLIAPMGSTIKKHYELRQMNALNAGDILINHVLDALDIYNNGLIQLILAGSKGSPAHFMSINAAIGQKIIMGKRPAETFGDRTMPYAYRNDSNPIAHGYIANSYSTGIRFMEMLFDCEEARVNLIKIALGTSVCGDVGRKLIKSMESIVIDNYTCSSKNDMTLQLIYGGDGADPRSSEKVKIITASKTMSNKKLEENYRTKLSQINKYVQDSIQEKNKVFKQTYKNSKATFKFKTLVTGVTESLLDDEFNQIKKDREVFRKSLINQENNISKRPYNDVLLLPVNIPDIIKRVINNFEDLVQLESINRSRDVSLQLNLKEAMLSVNQLCNDITYVLLNNIQKMNKYKYPRYMDYATYMIKIVIRSYLCSRELISNMITNDMLTCIIEEIIISYENAKIPYGFAVGINSAQVLAEVTTQESIDSKLAAGIQKKTTGVTRVKEIVWARATHKLEKCNPTMVIRVKPEYETNELKTQEIANQIEMLKLKLFVKNYKIFYEKLDNPVHPDYKHEKNMINEFLKYHKINRPPSDLTRWCIRFVLKKDQLLSKQMYLETIILKLYEIYEHIFIVHNLESADDIIIRIYVKNSYKKTTGINKFIISELVEEMQNTIIRGINGIKNAKVDKKIISEINSDGEIENNPKFIINTEGTNLYGVLNHPDIYTQFLQTDAILEFKEIYGIEAARTKILNELREQVSKLHYKHYALIADNMTQTGEITSMDFGGLRAREPENIGLHISDSRPITVMEEAAVDCKKSTLKNVSASIIFGQVPKLGSTYNRLIIDEEFVRENTINEEEIMDLI